MYSPKFILIFTILLLLIFQSETFAQHRTQVLLSPFDNELLQHKIENTASGLITEFNTSYQAKRNPNLNPQEVDATGSSTINSLWNTKPFFCQETEIIENLVKRPDGNYELRNIPLALKMDDGRTKYEEGVIIFTPIGVITNVYFGLETQRYKNLLREGKSVKEFRRRQIILDFVENYRTSYNRKDIDYITHVFSDNALIIVGRVLKVDKNSPNYLESSFNKQKVEYIKHNKQSYITALKNTFQRNKFINIGFDDIEIFQHPLYERIYGVTLLQHWTSSNYSDKGYLFLMVDFKDEDNPMIHVRTWQPEAYVSAEEVFSLGDFEIIQ